MPDIEHATIPLAVLDTSADLKQAEVFDLSHLTLHSTLADLPTDSFAVSVMTNGQVVADAFKRQPDLSGVIVMDKERVVTAVSRRRFLERVGRAYGIEVYLNRPIHILVEAIGTNHLPLPQQTRIQEAAEIALRRPANQFYEPIVVEYGDGSRRLLNAYVLLLAQAQLLALVNQVEQNRRQLAESLQKTGKALLSSLSLRKVTKRILKELSKVVTYERGLVLLRQDDHLQSIAWRGFPKDERSEHLSVAIQPTEDDVFQRILRTEEPVVIGDVLQEPSWQQLEWLPLNHSWLGVPLASPTGIIGLISLTRQPRHAFSEDDIALALTFAGQAAIALENARLYEQILNFNNQLEQKVAERTAELNQAYAVLAQLDKTKSDFIHVSAHELRTPLTVVKGYTQVLQIRPDIQEKPDVLHMLNGIEEGVNRLHRVVNSMLDVAKIDSNTLDVYLEPVAMAALIDCITIQLEDALQERQLRLTLSDFAELPPIIGDLDLLKKVFHALLV
ncbi:MAG: GAF domain-containing protein, partial [Anaerolineales bacterium]|nr:GAF domain-containing protein [Anaerolineales bacterium]